MGAGHVATVIAAAVVTAGGAIGIQQISAPASHHHSSHRVTADATTRHDGDPASTSSGTVAGSSAVADGITGGTAGLPISVTLPSGLGGGVLASAARASSTPAAAGAAPRAHRAPPLPINETQDPDHYLPPASGTVGSCTVAAVSSTCTGTGSSTARCPTPER